jgi:Fe-S cluster assembly protein SufD
MSFEINEVGKGSVNEKSLRYGLSILLPMKVPEIDVVEKPDITIRNKEELEAKGVVFKDCGNMSCIGTPREDVFIENHCKLSNSDLCVFVPDNLETDLVIEEIVDSNVAHNLIITVGKNAKLNVFEKTTGPGKFRSQVVEIITEDNSEVNYFTLQNLGDTFNQSIKRGTTGRNSVINWTDCNLGGSFIKTEVSSLLAGEGSRTLHKSLFFGNRNQVLDMYSRSIHSAPHTFSDMVTRGAVKGNSKAIYRGLVKIKENAPKSEGYQTEDTLILDNTAEADSIPELEIDNNDVKCSHGASVGKINEEEIFYLMSRGLSKEESKKKIVNGFFFSMLDALPKEVRGEVEKIIEGKYGENNAEVTSY